MLPQQAGKNCYGPYPWMGGEDKVKCYLNDKEAQPAIAGGYLVFGGLRKNDVIRLEFPVPESTEKYFIYDKTYAVLSAEAQLLT